MFLRHKAGRVNFGHLQKPTGTTLQPESKWAIEGPAGKASCPAPLPAQLRELGPKSSPGPSVFPPLTLKWIVAGFSLFRTTFMYFLVHLCKNSYK